MSTLSTSSPQRLAVFGSPIAHSKSPTLHRIAYGRLGLPWEYSARRVEALELADVIGGLGEDWRGLSLTMPLKQQAFALCDELDAIATATGAVNTIRFDRKTGGGQPGDVTLRGFNTDVGGIVRAIEAAGPGRVDEAVVLGGGATAASAVMAIAELGAEHVIVAVRTPAKAAHLVDLAAGLGLRVDVVPLDAPMPRVPLVVSTLPGGSGLDPTPLVGEANGALLFDVAYDPWPSPLASAWSAAGGEVLSGLAMLVHQAVLQVRIFLTGDPLIPLDDESSVLEDMLASVGLAADGSVR